MTDYVKNILACFDQVTSEELLHGKTWYSTAKDNCQAMADLYELPLRIVVGVVAALSPTNKWERNLVDANDMIKTFVEGGYVEDTTPCTYKAMRDKAWSILERHPQNEWDVETILKGPKITDFFWCIMGFNNCVIDGHAWCIANADRRTLQEVPNIGKRLREELQSAYLVAGNKHGLTAYEMQAATWVAWKRIYNV